MIESLKDHILEPLEIGQKVQAYYFKRPGQGRMMSTLILFTPEGIVLQGDLTPGQNGNVSCLGYGSGWFSSQLSEDYLCSKFLSKVFVRDYAERGLRIEILQARRDHMLSKERARELWGETGLPDDSTAPSEAYRLWTEELHYEDGDGCPGYGYAPVEAGWLCAIQQRFAQLFNEVPHD